MMRTHSSQIHDINKEVTVERKTVIKNGTNEYSLIIVASWNITLNDTTQHPLSKQQPIFNQTSFH